MEKTRLDISLLVNTPEACLSAYLPPSLNLDSYNSYGSEAIAGGGKEVTGSPIGYTKFLDAC